MMFSFSTTVFALKADYVVHRMTVGQLVPDTVRSITASMHQQPRVWAPANHACINGDVF